jgi:RIO kinase 1
MRVPESLMPLVEQGIIQEIIRPVMSGKEAEVFLVWSGGERRIAKVYKDALFRSFKHRSQYTEGRKTRNSRDLRAIAKRSRYGRAEEEQAWRATEVDIIYRLQEAGIRVPKPFDFVDGVLVMELVADSRGEPAPRLIDVDLNESEASELFFLLLRDVQHMLCAGVVHGDLSDFNVLLAEDGPVIIDFPQAVDPATNRNAQALLIRDVENLTSFLARYVPNLRRTDYGAEMWDLYERGELYVDTKLTGKVQRVQKDADLESLMAEIASAEQEDRARREALGLPPRRLARTPKVVPNAPPPSPIGEGRGKRRRKISNSGQPKAQPEPTSTAPENKKRKRKRRKGPNQAPAPVKTQSFDDFSDLDAFLLAED